MKRNEKIMIGGGMILIGLAVFGMYGMSMWEEFSNNIVTADTLKQEIQVLEQTQQGVQTRIDNLKKGVDLPDNVTIREYTPETRDAVIKLVVDQVVHKATENGNTLISLTPTAVEPIIPAETEEENTSAAGVNPNDPNALAALDNADLGAAPVDPAATGAPVITIGETEKGPPKPTLETFGYELAVRGTYDSIQAFLKSLANNRELMEMLSIKIENEAGVSRVTADATSTPFDPSRPIKLTATIRLVLQSAPIK